MQDSNIVYKVTAVGVEEAQAKFNALGATIQKMNFNANGTVTASGRLTSSLNNQSKATGNVAAATDRAARSQGNYFAHIAKTTVQSALINKLFLEFVDVSGQAIKQVDLMNNFPATMASMGQSTVAANEAFKSLSTYVGQVGGNLGDAASAVTRFTGVTKDVKSAVAIYTGLNNALIAGDSSMEEQRLAAIQFAQAFERGKPDMREWMALTQNMSFQLAQVAKAMGYVNAAALGEALRSGEEDMGAFTAKLTELSTGTGPIAVQAMARMNGMQFSFNVMKNTMVQGIAAIVNAFGRSNIVGFFNFLTQVIRVLTSWVITLINWLGNLANMISRLFGGGNVWKGITGDVQGVADGLKGAGSGADDLADGLKGAKKDAKELNKSLAAFDKMNVLPDKTSGKDKDDDKAGGGTNFDAAQLGALNNAFDGISGGLQEASKWAKIFAGILAGLAANALINKIFGVNVLKEFGKAVWKHAIVPLASHFVSAAGGAAKAAGTFATALGRGFLGLGSGGSGMLGTAAAWGAKLGLALRGGFISVFSGLGGVLRTVLVSPLAGIGRALITGILALAAPIAAALGVSLGVAVAIVVAIIAVIIGIIWLIWQNWDTIWKFIVAAYQATWNFIVGLWQQLYDIFAGPIKWLWQFIEGVFIVIVAIIAIALETIFKLWVGAFKLIFDLMMTVAGWINDNVIQPVWQFFQGLWDSIVAGVTAAWQWIFEQVLRPIGMWIYNNVILPIFNFYKKLWEDVAGFVTGFFNKVKEILGGLWNWVKINVVDRISGIFTGLWDGIKNGLSSMMEGLKKLWQGIGEIFKTPLNGIIDLINKAIGGINKLKVPDWVPGLGGKTPGLPTIPRLARGGIVEQATLAMIGEEGREAVVPLENNTEWIDKLAAQINASNNNNGQPVQLVVQIGEERIVTKVIELINEKTQMSGRNTILV